MSAPPDWIWQLLGTIAGCVGAYIAIRADLAALKAQMAIYEKSLERAHDRIDNLQGKP